MKELKRYFSYMGKHKYLYWFILIVTLMVESVLQIAYSYMNKQVLNAVEYQNMQLFQTAIVICIVVVILRCIFPYLRYFEIRLVRTMVFELKQKLFHKLLQLDAAFYEKNHSGEALKTLNWDANAMKDSWFSHVYWVLGKVTGGCTALIAMILYSPVLTVISLVISGITIWMSVRINAGIRAKAGTIQKSVANLAKRLSDILFGFPILKMYAGSFLVLEHYQQENEQVTRQENKRVRSAASLEMIAFLLGILGSFGTIIAGTFLVAEGKMDYGTVMALVTLQMSVSAMMQRVGGALAAFSTSFVKAGRVFDFLELDCEETSEAPVQTKENVSAAQRENGQSAGAKPIVIRQLQFAYTKGEPVLDGMNLEIENQEKVMIMGESGCGKSSLLKLLLRFYKETGGSIQIYGRDINQYSLEQLRKLITYIPQDSYLFEATIEQNIAYGNPAKSREELVAAARMAYADEFIRKLPQGYDTLLQPGGRNLSGGQRQRIAIARAFLKNSPILLMDEPASALDVESEQKIHAAIKQLMGNRVVLMVTHRKTGAQDFDRVVQL